jgi:hypothetical protein
MSAWERAVDRAHEILSDDTPSLVKQLCDAPAPATGRVMIRYGDPGPYYPSRPIPRGAVVGVDDLLGGVPSTRPAPRVERHVPVRGREIGGIHYVRTEDVVALLRANGVLPKAIASLMTRCPR